MKSAWRTQNIFDPSDIPYIGLTNAVEGDPFFRVHTHTGPAKQPPSFSLDLGALLRAAPASKNLPEASAAPPAAQTGGRPAPRAEAAVAGPSVGRAAGPHGTAEQVLPAPGAYPDYLNAGGSALSGVTLREMLKHADDAFEPLASIEGFILCEVGCSPGKLGCELVNTSLTM